MGGFEGGVSSLVGTGNLHVYDERYQPPSVQWALKALILRQLENKRSLKRCNVLGGESNLLRERAQLGGVLWIAFAGQRRR